MRFICDLNSEKCMHPSIFMYNSFFLLHFLLSINHYFCVYESHSTLAKFMSMNFCFYVLKTSIRCHIDGFAWLQMFNTSVLVVSMWVCVRKNNEICDWCIVWVWFWRVCLISISLILSLWLRTLRSGAALQFGDDTALS